MGKGVKAPRARRKLAPPKAKTPKAHLWTEEKLQQLDDLMKLSPTIDDTAHFFRTGKSEIEYLISTKYGLTFSEFRNQRFVHTRNALRKEAINQALGGNTTMLVFAMKNLCGWQDRVENIVNTQEIKITIEDEEL
jgi:hypothetical protein